VQDNIIPAEIFIKKRQEKEIGNEYDHLLSELEVERLIESLFLGQGQCSEVEGIALIRWAQKARLHSLMLESILNGYVNCQLNENNNVQIVTIEEEEDIYD
jgi:hypothetical protein